MRTASSQVQVYQFVTDSTGGEDAKVGEEEGDEASGDQEGVKDAEAVMEVSKEINDVD